MRKLLAKLLFCDLEDLNNVRLHIWVGIGNVLLPVALCFALPRFFSPLSAVLIALLFGYGFLKYQRIEQKTVKDRAFPEIQGWLWGIVLSSFGLAIIALILRLILR